MKKRIIMAATAGLLAISMIAGCSNKSSIAEAGYNSEMASEASYAVKRDIMDISGDAAFANAGTGDFGYDYEEYYDENSVTSGSPDPAGDVNIDPSLGRLLIRTVSITAETTKYSEVASNLESQVKGFGGYIEYSSMQGTGNNKDLRTGVYTVRVPADKLDALISSVNGSCTVIASNEGTSDVTLEYVDTKSRIDSLRVEYDQLMELLGKANDLDTIIILQNRLTEVRYQIESAESRIRVLENQVQYATLSLILREVLEEKEIEEAHVVTYGEKVMNQFKDMWESTVEFFQNLLLGIIAFIPGLIFLAITAAVVLIIVFSARKKRRARIARARAEKEAAEKKAEKQKTDEKKADEKSNKEEK